MRISDWSSDVCSSDLLERGFQRLWHGVGRACPVEFPRMAGIARTRHDAQLRPVLARAGRGRHILYWIVHRQHQRRGMAKVQLFDETGPREIAEDDRLARSEERRAGQEGVRTCRSRWGTCRAKNKTQTKKKER